MNVSWPSMLNSLRRPGSESLSIPIGPGSRGCAAMELARGSRYFMDTVFSLHFNRSWPGVNGVTLAAVRHGS